MPESRDRRTFLKQSVVGLDPFEGVRTVDHCRVGELLGDLVGQSGKLPQSRLLARLPASHGLGLVAELPHQQVKLLRVAWLKFSVNTGN